MSREHDQEISSGNKTVEIQGKKFTVQTEGLPEGAVKRLSAFQLESWGVNSTLEVTRFEEGHIELTLKRQTEGLGEQVLSVGLPNRDAMDSVLNNLFSVSDSESVV